MTPDSNATTPIHTLASIGPYLLSGSPDGRVLIWKGQDYLHSVPSSSTAVTCVCAVPGTKGELLSAGLDRKVSRWLLRAPRKSSRSRLRLDLVGTEILKGPVTALAIASRSLTVAAASDKTIEVYELGAAQDSRTFAARDTIQTIVITPDGNRVIIATLQDYATIHNAHTGEIIDELNHGTDSWVKTLAVETSGRRAFTAGLDGTVVEWDLATGVRGRQLSGHTDQAVQAIAVAPDDSHVAWAGEDTAVHVCKPGPLNDAGAGNVTIVALRSSTPVVRSLVFATDGGLAAGGHDGRIQTWSRYQIDAGEPNT